MTATTEKKPEKKTRKGRKPANKTPYRGENDPKLTEWPTDWDSAKHEPLKEEDFQDEVQYLFWDKRVEVYRRRMEEALNEADLCRKYGSRETREKASKIEKLKAQLEQLKATLPDDLVD